MKELTICIPAYNEEQAIGNTLRGLKKEFPDAEIIVVDDGSKDRTREIAKSITGIQVLSHGKNTGYGSSIKTAIKNSTRDFVAWYDADGQHTPEDLVKVANEVINGNYDIVIGVRDNKSDRTINRMPGKFVLKILAQFVTGSKIPDLNSGMRCFKKNIIKKYLHLLPDGFSASSTTTLLMQKRGYRVGHVIITTDKRKGASSVGIIKDGWGAIKLILRILVLFEAFNFFLFLALMQLLPSLIYGFYMAFVNKMGFPVLASTLVISGVLTFFMGIICDQITELRKEKFEE